MRVLVTGGAGFIGSHVVERLMAAGHSIHVVDNLATGRREHVPPGTGFTQIGVENPALAVVFDAFRPEAVVHCAAQTGVAVSWGDPLLDAVSNVTGTANLLAACARHRVRRVIYLSSAAVYGNPDYLPVDETHPLRPTSPYGLTKRVGEEYLALFARQCGLETVALRLANVYGPRQRSDVDGGVVAVFAERLVAGLPLEVHGDGEQTRDFVFVGDVARAVQAAVETPGGLSPSPAVFNVSTGTAVSVRALIAKLEAAAGRTVEVHYGPPRPGDIRHSRLANDNARRHLGWAPETGLEQGLRLIAEAAAPVSRRLTEARPQAKGASPADRPRPRA